jgi:hypothetical protein
MELGEPGAQRRILDARQDPVAQPLVHRHAATPCGAGRHHPRAEDRVALAPLERSDDLRQALRRVLAVAVQEHHDVQPALNGRAIPGLLVATVAEVPQMPDDRRRRRVVGCSPAHGDVHGVVHAGVVEDQDLVDPGPEVDRDAVQRGGEGRLRVVRHDQDPYPPALPATHACLSISEPLRAPLSCHVSLPLKK